MVMTGITVVKHDGHNDNMWTLPLTFCTISNQET